MVNAKVHQLLSCVRSCHPIVHPLELAPRRLGTSSVGTKCVGPSVPQRAIPKLLEPLHASPGAGGVQGDSVG